MINGSVTILAGGRSECDASWASRPGGEAIRSYKLYDPVSGSAWVTCGGQRTVLRPGRIYMLPGNTQIEHGCPGKFTLNWMHFDIEYTRQVTPQIGSNRVLSWRARPDDFWLSAMRRVDRTLQSPSPADSAALVAVVMFFVAEALAMAGDSRPSARQIELFDRLNPAIRYMNDHYLINPSLAEIAEQISLSPEYFHRLFEEATGKTPFNYMLARRMNCAVRFLAATDLAIGQVGEACGYKNPFYFSRVFKRYFGVSPKSARQNGLRP